MAGETRRLASITIFRTPVLRTVLGWIGGAVLWMLRWTTRVRVPEEPRLLIVLAPHTSYWDFPLLISIALRYRVDAHWLGTHNLFRGPGGPLFRWLGGIPVDRSRRQGLVGSVVEAFGARDRLIVGIAPEGSRFRRERWKTGFYRIAVGAGVPLWLVGMDYPSRTVVAEEVVRPTGDLEADLARIGEYFATFRGRHSDWYTAPLG